MYHLSLQLCELHLHVSDGVAQLGVLGLFWVSGLILLRGLVSSEGGVFVWQGVGVVGAGGLLLLGPFFYKGKVQLTPNP